MPAPTDAEHFAAVAAWEKAPVLVCRGCGSPSIYSLDQYLGTCAGEARQPDGKPAEFDPGGYTEINWDSCTQVGWGCSDCGASVQVEGTGEEALDEALGQFTMTEDRFREQEERHGS